MTRFPILFPAETPERATGVTTCPITGEDVQVRTFAGEDWKRITKNLEGNKGKHLFALMQLRNALTSGDSFDREKAKEKLKKLELPEPKSVGELYIGENDPVDFLVEALRFIHEDCTARGRPDWDLPQEEWLRYRQAPDFSDLPKKLCFEVTDRINANGTRLVLWWQNGRPVFAIYCPNLETAYYIHAFFTTPAGGIGWHVCPWCSCPFEPSREGQKYCSNKHGDAHRMARMRFNRKLKTKQKGKRTNGTKKTR